MNQYPLMKVCRDQKELGFGSKIWYLFILAYISNGHPTIYLILLDMLFVDCIDFAYPYHWEERLKEI